MAADFFEQQALESIKAVTGNYHQVAVALSGGPDSTALALLVARWCESTGRPSPWAFIIDHGIRQESSLEANLVALRARSLGLRPVMRSLSLNQHPSQAAMRQHRYQALL